ncbi:Protein of unknown function [Streptomyces sp. DI166]|uniref:DUF2742 domain-containing protein n=1 Tax=Streptomyces sp. DI166 TaxID=1839783 RepID=UPI0007F4DC00|nr:DUF2742 domain-containing protein [Streptomyces sp. DI166]SBT91378.1 Protein of unknown function [Streptomyces sp. DI166]
MSRPATRLRLADTGGRARLHTAPTEATAGEITHLRACAQADSLDVDDWPEYGSLPWLQLPPDDPRVYVATLEAAELHRMHVERIAADAHTQAFNVLRTAAEARAARKGTMRTRTPHMLTPTPGWPPIQIPGRPGEYLTYQESSA